MKNSVNLFSFRAGSAAWNCRAVKTPLSRLARFAALILFCCLCVPARAQSNEWAWMGGSSAIGAKNHFGHYAGKPGIYGKLGTAAPGNVPGSRAGAASWADRNGHFWLFGGDGYDADGIEGYLNDLWEFTPSTGEWAWTSGSANTNCQSRPAPCGSPGVYGTLRVPAEESVPGGRFSSSNWTDHNGNLWLLGGGGIDGNSTFGLLNDLWAFQAAAGDLPAMNPSFDASPGIYTSAQIVKIADSTPGATINYTLDGSTPSNKSSKYAAAILVGKTTTIKAMAQAANYAESAVAAAA